MSSTGTAFLDATGQAALVRAGEVSPLELVEAAIERAERLDPQLNAIVTPQFEEARTAASAPLPAGPFRGVPFLLKDAGSGIAGLPQFWGNGRLRDAGRRAPVTAPIARRLVAAGFVLLGTTSTPELAIQPTTQPLAFGPTRGTLGTSSARSAARAAARPRRWPRASSRSRRAATPAGRSGCRPAGAASSG